MYLNLSLQKLTNGAVAPLQNAFVYIWHCNASGVYSGEAVENTSGQTWLRGYQVSDANGSIPFITIYPGWYSGRTTHIHLRVRLYPNNDPTQTPTYDFDSQLFFDDSITSYLYRSASPYTTRPTKDTSNLSDDVYSAGRWLRTVSPAMPARSQPPRSPTTPILRKESPATHSRSRLDRRIRFHFLFGSDGKGRGNLCRAFLRRKTGLAAAQSGFT